MNVILEALWLLVRIFYYNLEAVYRWIVPPAAKNISGEVALVTGAGRGIGREIALALAKRGAQVVVCDINEEACTETARIIAESGGTAKAYRCDVTNVDAVADMAARVRREVGNVDILVNNAGVLVVKNILELTDDEIRRTINVNTVAQFWTVRQFLPSMIERKHGHIVIVVSMAGLESSQMLTDYCTSKFGAHGFAEALSDDLRFMKVSGVDITTVYPLFVDTNMILDINDRIVSYDRFHPNVTPQQVAQAAVDGLQRRQRHVYIPSTLGIVHFLRLLPVKAKVAVKECIGSGFYKV